MRGHRYSGAKTACRHLNRYSGVPHHSGPVKIICHTPPNCELLWLPDQHHHTTPARARRRCIPTRLKSWAAQEQNQLNAMCSRRDISASGHHASASQWPCVLWAGSGRLHGTCGEVEDVDTKPVLETNRICTSCSSKTSTARSSFSRT